MSDERPPPVLLTRVLRLLGYLTDPKSTPGKVFTRWERGMTAVMGRLATSDRFLRLAGGGLEASFLARKLTHEAMEELLAALRLPAASEVHALRHEVRVLGDRLEATTSQLELALELLERVDAQSALAAAAANPANTANTAKTATTASSAEEG